MLCLTGAAPAPKSRKVRLIAMLFVSWHWNKLQTPSVVFRTSGFSPVGSADISSANLGSPWVRYVGMMFLTAEHVFYGCPVSPAAGERLLDDT